jgi:hypothetical protein
VETSDEWQCSLVMCLRLFSKGRIMLPRSDMKQHVLASDLQSLLSNNTVMPIFKLPGRL